MSEKYIMRGAAEKENRSDDGPRAREEFAKGFIDSLRETEKFLRAGTGLKPVDSLLDEMDEYIAEEKRNGRA